jgi:hypothetical protein
METKVDIHIMIDHREYNVHQTEMTGAQLKALAGIPGTNLLFLEVHGPGEDEAIANDTAVHLRDGEHFYDMPPGNFGTEQR